MRTGDQSLVKELNKAIVLQIVRNLSPISRAAIAKVSGLNKATVSAMVDALIEGRLVTELGPGESSGGRRPQLLLFNDRAGYVAGVDLGVRTLFVALMDLRAQILWKRRVSLNPAAGPDACLERVAELVEEGLRALPAAPFGLMGVGVGAPGLVDHEAGRLIFAPNLPWGDVPIRTWLHRRLRVPIYVDNEANAGAIGELWAGAAAGVKNLVYLSVGPGLGAGIILNGELFRGADGVAGELGHTTIDASGPVCGCGSRGCWEMYASEAALRQQVLRFIAAGQMAPSPLARLGPDEISTLAVVGAAVQGDPVAIAALSAIGESLGLGIANLVNIFNPSLVVIGSAMAEADSYVINPARRVVEQRALAYPRSRARLIRSALGVEACAIGAGALVLQEQFRLPAVTA